MVNVAFEARIVIQKTSRRGAWEVSMAGNQRQLRSQELRTRNHQGHALSLGINSAEEPLSKPQVLVESARGIAVPQAAQPVGGHKKMSPAPVAEKRRAEASGGKR